MDFADWLKAKGIEWPNLGVNWPAGNAWGAADLLDRAYRQYSEEQNKLVENSNGRWGDLPRVPKT